MKRLPLGIAIALVIAGTWDVIGLVVDLVRTQSLAWPVSGGALAIAAWGAWLAGLGELARRRRAGVGIRIAQGAVLVPIAWYVANGWVIRANLYQGGQGWAWDLATAMPYLWSAGMVALAAGLAVAAGRARAAGGVAACLGVALASAPPVLAHGVLSRLDHGDRLLAGAALELARLALFAVLAVRASADRPVAAEPARAVAGLRDVVRALWLRVAAIVGVSYVAVAAFEPFERHSLIPVTIGALAISVLVACVFARGVASIVESEPDGPRLPLFAAGMLELFVAGAIVEKLPYTWDVLHGTGPFVDMAEITSTLATTLPLLEIAAGALVAYAIAVLARRRNLPELVERATGKAVGFVALTLASAAAQHWFAPHADTQGKLFAILLCATLGGLWAIVLLANLCSEAADAFDRPPVLPTATVVSPP